MSVVENAGKKSQLTQELCVNKILSYCYTVLCYCGCKIRCIFTEVNQLSVSLPPQAQVCLASVYTQEPVRDGNRSVQYLKMAAESGVSALLDASRVLSLALLLSVTTPPAVPAQSFFTYIF